MMESKSLFGGAIECRLPVSSIDLSDIRPVPSHQECWFLETDQRGSISFTIEIFERRNDVSDEDITEFLFRDLAEDNRATACQCAKSLKVVLPNLSASNTSVSIGHRSSGNMMAVLSTFPPGEMLNSHPTEILHVEICVIRLPQQSADIILTIMVPIRLHDLCHQARLWMDEMIASFHVRDWGVFIVSRE